MWEIQFLWNNQWVTVQTGFASRDDAEWATGLWKQQNDCRGDPFRAVKNENRIVGGTYHGMTADEALAARDSFNRAIGSTNE